MPPRTPADANPLDGRRTRWLVLVFVVAVLAETVTLALAEIELLGLAARLSPLQHLAATVGATPWLVLGWWAARRWRLGAGTELGLLLLGAFAIRAVLWFEPLEGTVDAFRYWWDGRVQDHGINPYLHAPQELALAPLRDPVYFPQIFRRHLPTCYPPVAEAWFWVGYKLTPTGFGGWKAVLLLHELATVPLLWAALRRRGLPGGQATVYALAPLAVVQSMVGLHMDSLYAPWLAAAFLLHRRRPGAAAAAIVVAAMVRPLAIVGIPALLWDRSWRDRAWIVAGGGLAGVACLWPYADAGVSMLGSIPTYMMEWEFNGAIYGLSKYLLDGDGETARTIGYVVIVLLCAVAWTRTRWTVAGRTLAAAGAYYLFTPTLYPWYLLLCLVPWVLVGGITPLVLGAAVALSDTVEIPHQKGLPWRVPTHWLALEYGLVFAALLFDGVQAVRRRRRAEGDDAR